MQLTLPDGRTYEVSRAETQIGRAPDNDIVLDDPLVSSRHAVIVRQNKGFALMDTGSRNGTQVNGKPVPPKERRAIFHGDTIQAGKQVLTVRDQSPDLAQTLIDAGSQPVPGHAPLAPPSARLQGGQSPVDEFWRKLTQDEQEPEAVQAILSRVQPILTSNERIEYVAVQKGIVNFTPDAVVLTNRRFILYRPKLLGRVEFEDYIWRELRDARLEEGVFWATITLQPTAGRQISLDHLPKVQARKVYAFAQEMEERMLEERRQRDLEDKRAAAGGIILQGGMGAAPMTPEFTREDPLDALRKLKAMHAEGLISADEYERKKAEIMSRM